MGNIDPNTDDLINRLGKLVPVYVISLLGLVSAFFQAFYDIDPLQAQIAIYITIVIGVIATILVETKRKDVDNKKQLVLASISTALWIFFINIRFFDLAEIGQLWIQFGIALYTFGIGILSKYIF